MNLRLTNMGEPRLVMVLKDDMSNVNNIIKVLQFAGFSDVHHGNLNSEAPYWFVSESGSDPWITCGALSCDMFVKRFDISCAPINILDNAYDGFMSAKFKKFIDEIRLALRDGKVGM